MHRIVVVGGGIAGIVVATHMGRRSGRRNETSILLVDRNPAHVWKPMLHTFAAGTATYANESIPFVSQAKRAGFHFWPGTLAGLDRAAGEVELGPVRLPDGVSELPGRRVPFDTLVIAVGSRANDFGTPGVAEHCRFIDNIGEAERFGALLRTRIAQAVAEDRDVSVAIVGGGATGVELAAELRLSADILSSYATWHRASRLRLTLIESGPHLVAGFPEEISDAVKRKLGQLRVEVRLDTKVVGADETGVLLEGGGRVDSDLMAWVAGVKAPDVLKHLDGLEVARNGQLLVRPTLQTTVDDRIFALGDCARFEGANGKPLPTTAQVARQQAQFLARSLRRHLRWGRPLRPFAFRNRGSLVSLGDYAAYGTLGNYGFFSGGVIRGRLAELGHAALYRQHQMDLTGLLRGGATWLGSDLMRVGRSRVVLS